MNTFVKLFYTVHRNTVIMSTTLSPSRTKHVIQTKNKQTKTLNKLDAKKHQDVLGKSKQFLQGNQFSPPVYRVACKTSLCITHSSQVQQHVKHVDSVCKVLFLEQREGLGFRLLHSARLSRAGAPRFSGVGYLGVFARVAGGKCASVCMVV